MPPPRRLCSLAGGVLLLFLCLSFMADQLDTRGGLGRVGREGGPPHNMALLHPLNLTAHWPLPVLTITNVSSAGRGVGGKHGQCKKKYWRCDSPPTDPEPPLEELQELETLPAQAFTAPHWTQYANRGYTVVDRNESAAKRLPDVLIIGAKKSGTRALLAFLRVHPSIKASGPEVHYFDRFYSRGLDWYKTKLPLSLTGQLTVEKTPAYFTTAGVPARVRQDLPHARLLLVVRDPVTRALSDYTQSLSKHRSRRPFEELAFVRSSPGLVNSDWGPISGGLYARHLQRWLDHFPRTSIHIVSGENLISDPAAELCKVQEFLGLRRVITEKHFFFNVTKGFPCLVKREKTGRPHCLGSSKGRSHPPVSQATFNTLRDFYRPFNFKFYKIVGQNFRW